MKKKANLLELLVWAALVSFIVMAPAHSQAVANGQTLFGQPAWSANFDMDSSVDAAGNLANVENSSGAQGDMGHETIKQAKPAQLPKSPKAMLEYADNGNITMGSMYGNTRFPSGSYSYGFDGRGASVSPFNTGLPSTSTGSVDLNICD
ncbi:MAG: hypothetical protein JST89_01160 [Cyanobacteria bacterium SZAS-4]|nr:hypothetical protein [Cyanobacteria bacterium SZAS-4]